MSRFKLVDPQHATGETRELLDSVEAQLGMVPNFVRVFANSPKALAGFLGFSTPLAEGRLDQNTRTRIALALAESNACQYCLSAHEAMGEQGGLDRTEITAARRGGSREPKADAAVRFALAVNQHRGEVSAAEFDLVRRNGFGDGEIVEIIAVVALNVLTNMLGKAGQIDIDFQQAAALEHAA